MKRTAIKRYTPLRKKRSTPRSHKFIVRLTGAALTKLRKDCFARDGYRCVDCAWPVTWDEEEAYKFGFSVGEMSHIRAKRNNGDSLDNVVTRCRACHEKSHNCGGKPLPRKA